MCEYTDECVCHQAAGPSRPLSTAISQSPDVCSPGDMLLSCWCRLAVFFSFLLPVWKNQNPRARSEPPRRDLPPPSCPWLNPGLALLQQPCPTSPERCKEALSWVWRQAVRLKVGMCDTAAVRLSMGYGMCRWGRPEFLFHSLQGSRITRRTWESRTFQQPSAAPQWWREEAQQADPEG